MNQAGTTMGVYIREDIAEIWKARAKAANMPAARWGAEAIIQRLERENALPGDPNQSALTAFQAALEAAGPEEVAACLSAFLTTQATKGAA